MSVVTETVVLLDGHLQPHAVIVRDGIQVVHDVEARTVFAAGELEVVHGREVHQHVEAE